MDSLVPNPVPLRRLGLRVALGLAVAALALGVGVAAAWLFTDREAERAGSTPGFDVATEVARCREMSGDGLIDPPYGPGSQCWSDLTERLIALGVEGNDAEVCQALQGTDETDWMATTCRASVAHQDTQSFGKLVECMANGDEDTMWPCLADLSHEVAARGLPRNDRTVCEVLPEEFVRPFCEAEFVNRDTAAAVGTGNAEDCAKLPEEYGREGCYVSLAVQQQDSALCERSASDYAKLSCLKAVAAAAQDVAACRQIERSVIATSSMDQLEVELAVNGCLEFIAVRTNNPSLCSTLVSLPSSYSTPESEKHERAVDRWQCLHDLAVKNRDLAVCELDSPIPEGNLEGCLSVMQGCLNRDCEAL